MPKSQIHFLLSNLFAGVTAGLVTLVYSISFAALIFSGNLAQFFPQGVGSALIGATVTAIVVAWRSGFSFVLAGPESNSAVILAVMASAIANSLVSLGSQEQIYPTVWLAIGLSTIITGLFLFIIGWLRLGRWARFIPYPVIGGFLAGTGWLIARSSFKVMTGIPLNLTELLQLFQLETLPHWLVGGIFCLVLCLTLNHYKHFLVLPGLLLSGIVSFDLLWWLIQIFAKMSPEKWFFEPFPVNELWKAWRISTFTQVDWSVLVHQSAILMAMIVIVVISILLNATGLELAVAKNIDLDRELRVNGVANLINGFVGGMVGYISSNRSLLNRQAGANSPLAGMISGVLCGAVLISGSSFLSYLPKPILGGLLLYIGLIILVRWGYQARLEFPLLDYALILLILVIIAVWGFLQGVGAGIAISCFLFIFNYGRTPIVKYAFSGRSYQSNVQRSLTQQRFLVQEGDRVYILVLQGFIFFGTANTLFEIISQRIANSVLPKLEFIIFDFRLVNGLDSSVVMSFIKMKQLAEKSQIKLVFSQLQPALFQLLRQGGLFDLKVEICYLFNDLDRSVEWCENHILLKNKLEQNEFVSLLEQLQSTWTESQLVVKIMSYLELLEIACGEFLFRQGDPADGLYFLESGQVSIVLELTDGQTKRLRTYNSGTILGEIGFYSKDSRSASVIADQFCHLYYLSDEALKKLEQEEPQLAIAFHKFIVNLLAERLKRREEELKNLLQ